METQKTEEVDGSQKAQEEIKTAEPTDVKSTSVAFEDSQDGQQNNRDTQGLAPVSTMVLESSGVASGSQAVAAASVTPAGAAGVASGSSPAAEVAPAAPTEPAPLGDAEEAC